MTDNEIIKALECCPSKEYIVTYYDDEEIIVGDILTFIKRQQAEIERLEAEYTRACAERDARICTADFFKAEAIKEFAERLKEKSSKISLVCSGALVKTDYTIAGTDLDNLVKEMVGDDNDR